MVGPILVTLTSVCWFNMGLLFHSSYTVHNSKQPLLAFAENKEKFLLKYFTSDIEGVGYELCCEFDI